MNEPVRVTPAAFAVIVTGVDALTLVVVTVKVALVAPWATVTLAGAAAALLLSDNITTNPPDGAAAVSATVPCDELPPTTDDGLIDSADSEAGAGDEDGVTIIGAARVTPPHVAEIVDEVEAVTDVVAMVKLALVDPAATVTFAGTDVAVELSESETSAPPLGAAALSVTVPLDELPPTTLLGLTDTVESAALGGGEEPAVTSSSACFPGLPARSAKMFMLNCELTGLVTMVKVALVAPAGMVTLDGIVATVAGAGVESATTVLPLCGALSVTVPVDGLPPATLVGLTETPDKTGADGAFNTLTTELKL